MSDWRQTTVGELLTLEYGKPLPEKARDGQGFPVYGSNGIVGYHSQELVKGPGVIVGRKGSSGAVNFSEADFSPIDTAFYVLVKDSAEIGMEFAYHLLVNAKLTELTTQTGVPGLTRSRAYEIRVALPPLPVQERIVEVIGVVTDQITALDAEADALGALLRGRKEKLFAHYAATETALSIGEVLGEVKRPITVDPDAEYRQIGTRSHGRGLFTKEAVTGESLGSKKVFWVEPGDLVINIVFAWEGAVAIVPPEIEGYCGSHRFPTYRRLDCGDVEFFRLFFSTKTGTQLLASCSPGGRDATAR